MKFTISFSLSFILVTLLIVSCSNNGDRKVEIEDVNFEIVRVDTLGLLVQKTKDIKTGVILKFNSFPFDSNI